MGGWDRNKIKDYRTTLARMDGKYYLVIVDKSNSAILETLKRSGDTTGCELLDYKLIPGASKQLPHVFFSGKGIGEYYKVCTHLGGGYILDNVYFGSKKVYDRSVSDYYTTTFDGHTLPHFAVIRKFCNDSRKNNRYTVRKSWLFTAVCGISGGKFSD